MPLAKILSMSWLVVHLTTTGFFKLDFLLDSRWLFRSSPVNISHNLAKLWTNCNKRHICFFGIIRVLFITKKKSSVYNSVEVPFWGQKRAKWSQKSNISYLENRWSYELGWPLIVSRNVMFLLIVYIIYSQKSNGKA